MLTVQAVIFWNIPTHGVALKPVGTGLSQARYCSLIPLPPHVTEHLDHSVHSPLNITKKKMVNSTSI